MHTHADKNQQTTAAVTAQHAPRQEETTSAISDNRPDNEAFVQLQAIADRHAVNHPLSALQRKTVDINDDAHLENEADVMGQKALQTRSGSGNGLTSAPVSAVGQHAAMPVQRAIRLEGHWYTAEDQRGFISKLQTEMPRAGYSVTNKLLAVVVDGLKGKGALNDGKFASVEAFIDFVADQGLTSPKITSKSVAKRARNLGKRPGFSRYINLYRQSVREKTGEIVAARHVIPSHLLGYAAENLTEDVDELRDWIGKYGDVQVKSNSPRVLKQEIWRILHNHTGNLWIGNSQDNSAIGFSSGDIESFREEILKSEDPYKLVSDSVREMTNKKVKHGLAKAMGEVRQAATGAFLGIISEYKEALEIAGADKALRDNAFENFRMDLTEVWEQVEGDVASFSLAEYKETSRLLSEFGNKPTLRLLSGFMEHRFQNTIPQQQNDPMEDEKSDDDD